MRGRIILNKVGTNKWATVLFCFLTHSATLLADELPRPDQSRVLKAVFSEKLSTLDPAVAYDSDNFSLIGSACDSLVTSLSVSSHGLSMAASYTLSEDKKTHRFTLKQGLLFHNGEEVTAEDFRYSLERTLSPSVKSPGAGFFYTLLGYDDFRSGKSPQLAGLRVLDRYTVEIETAEVDTALLKKLSLPFACIVHRASVEADGGFDANPVTAGPFQIKNWNGGQYVVLERFEGYHRDNIPALDRIEFQFGVNRLRALYMLSKGEIDFIGSALPEIKVIKANRDEEYRELIAEDTSFRDKNVIYIALNTEMAPLVDRRFRQALNHAIDRVAIEQLLDNTVISTQQIPPRAVVGFIPDYEPYPYSPQTAHRLLAESGVDLPVSLELHYLEKGEVIEIGQMIQRFLADVNIKVVLHGWSTVNELLEVADDPDRAHMILSEGVGWVLDFIDPTNIYLPLLSTRSMQRGGWNWSRFSNDRIDKLAREAQSLDQDDPKYQIAWETIFRDINIEAPWIPLYSRDRYMMVGARVKVSTRRDIKGEIVRNWDFISGTHYQRMQLAE